MKKIAAVVLLALLTTLIGLAPADQAQLNAPEATIYLRRAAFDPLRALPAIASAPQPARSSQLQLLQFTSVPTAATRAQVAALHARTLLYIPTNALLVRVPSGQPISSAALPGLRWAGLLPLAYKYSTDLDAAMITPAAGMLDLQLLAAPDADLVALAQAIAALGGELRDSSAGLNGTTMRAKLPAAALGSLVARDDLLWAERAFTPQIANDRARTILGITAARTTRSWLTGTGQIIAVTDTGLDVQSTIMANGNPDFAASRIAQAFTPQQMNPGNSTCQSTNIWNDRNGHGTHVSGTALGGGRAADGFTMAGMAPDAQLVVQAVSSGGLALDCLPLDSGFLAKAYAAGARIQNASWGQSTSETGSPFGGYTSFDSLIDDYLWLHKDHLLVVSAGNYGVDGSPRDGVINPDSITSPGTAKNVLTVGASENNRPPTGTSCQGFGYGQPPQDQCYGSYGSAPIASDFVSNNPAGMAAFSGRGPTDDGRIKPEIVAPGTNIVSTRSHDPAVGAGAYFGLYDTNYAYDSGTSMSTPMISGMAALVRQWLAYERGIATPSAALVKALLLNGATDLSPGQYGSGSAREIPAAWPNSVEGWGRAALTETVGLKNSANIWLADNTTGITNSATASYTVTVAAGQPLRASLVWTDYPASPIAGRNLINDLDLEVQAPNGQRLLGNASAAIAASCRDSLTQADRCNNAESVDIAVPSGGVYIVRVRGTGVPQGPQPFALTVRAQSVTDTVATSVPSAPTLQPITGGTSGALALSWSYVSGATTYQVQESADSSFTQVLRTITTTWPELVLAEPVGSYWFRVRACSGSVCGADSNAQLAIIRRAPLRVLLPVIGN